jgi:hypothetical protein
VPELKRWGLAAKIISALLAGRSPMGFKPIAGTLRMIALGRTPGIVQLPSGRVDPHIAMMQKDMFVSRYLGPVRS